MIRLDPVKAADWGADYLPGLARFTLSATLLVFFWRSALTKLGDGISGLWTPSLDAFVQVLPWRMDAVGYDPEALGWIEHLVVILGMWAEFALPLMVAIGLFTRLSAVSMIMFIVVMSVVDIFGHGVAAGSWFDGTPDAAILDQRLFWLLTLMLLVLFGGGRFSVDRFWQGHASRKNNSGVAAATEIR